ncbi:MAG: FAD-dependent oxidoreductase [Acetobacteraceae bacterium]|nr:FAD-dependent oxidoreductase [Acetobacteraceae bacterium]
MTHDCVIVGAGPAGMAAASLLARHGADVVVLDEQPAPGGQIWRGIEAADAGLRAVLGGEYAAGAAAVAEFRASGASYRPGQSVWNITPELDVWTTPADGAGHLRGRTVLLAVGAMERPVPIPGWTLPGAMGAGGVQILLKSANLLPQGLVLAGQGPLLYQLATQCIAAGAPPAAILDAARPADVWPALRLLRPAALPYLHKGLLLQGTIRAAGIPWYRGVTRLRLLGGDAVAGVRFHSGGQDTEIAANLVALHDGVIPAQHAARVAGCTHRWDAAQACFHPVLDAWGSATVPGLLVAGDAGGIGGAAAAVHQGRIAAADILRRLGRLDEAGRDRLAAADRRALARHLAIRPFLDRRYRPIALVPDDSVTVCRCEEVTAADLRAAVAMGCQGPNQAKSFTRAGMGPCQGRMCGTTVTTVLAAALGRPPGDVGHARVRPPLKPITVGELAEAT